MNHKANSANIRKLINVSKFNEAEILCRESLKSEPNEINLLTQLACIYFEQKKFADASELLRKIIEENQTINVDFKFSLYATLSECLSQLKKHSEAEEIYNVLDKIQPNNSEIITNLGIVCIHQYKFDLAFEYFERSSRLRTPSATLLFSRGYLFEKLRRLEEALADYERVLLINPEHSDANKNVQRLRKRLNLISDWKTSKEEAPIVMVGNSHFEYVEWNSMFPDKKIANRGIGGDCTINILRRMDSILSLKSQKAFVQVGLGDFNDLNLSVEEVFLNYQKMVGILHENIDDVYILSTIKINPEKMGNDSARLNYLLDELNIKLASLVSPGVHFIEVNHGLCNDAGLRHELTDDGVHLNLEGYAVLRELLRSSL